jgi:hypothetical protein
MRSRSLPPLARDSGAESELDFHASDFVVRVDGSCTNAHRIQFRHLLKLRRLAPSQAELSDTINRTRTYYAISMRRVNGS